nr:MAG TPA: hypothetical protein [Caudoviricetes sp.]
MSISIDIKRSYLPVKIGEIELQFDTSLENISRLATLQQDIADRFNKYQLELLERSNAGEFDDLKEGVINKRVLDEAFEIQKKMTEIKYDVLFGDGTFAKLYDCYPDIEALDSAFDEVDTLLGAEFDRMGRERAKASGALSESFVKKAKAKKTKKASKK